MEPATLIAERRRHDRISNHAAAWIRLVDSWTAARLEIQVLDISQGGLKLRVPEFLRPGTLVQIHLQGVAAAGLREESLLAVAEVRYCIGALNGFDAGVVFQAVFPER